MRDILLYIRIMMLLQILYMWMVNIYFRMPMLKSKNLKGYLKQQ